MTGSAAADPLHGLEIVEVERRRLIEDEALLEEIFSVLVVAHYRNSPNDLQMLMEAPGHVVYAAVLEGSVAGALEAVVEPRVGGRGSGVVPDIFERMGWGGVGRGYRVVRIAVAPCVQRRGVGSRLLRALEERARDEQLDWVGASFGHHEPLPFWLRNGYTPVHVSPRFNPATGEKNIVVVKPLTPRAEEVVARASCSLLHRLVVSGSSVYRDVEAEVLAALLDGIPPGCEAHQLTSEQASRLELFLEGRLAYESVHDALLLGFEALHSRGAYHGLPERDKILAVLLVVQGKPVYEAEKLLGLNLREAEDRLRAVYSALASESPKTAA